MSIDKGYEIHSILEFGDDPAPGLWWVLSPSGESPPIRAGANVMIRKSENSFDDKIIFSGGGTPTGFIKDVTELSLLSGSWEKLPNEGLVERYEHVMIEVDNNLSILLGSGNIGNVPAQTLCADKWEKLDFSGTIPSDRTVSQTARFENKVYIWSGGGPKGPISDLSVYIIEGRQIKREKLSGEIPPPLQEFAFCVDENYLYIHGGLSATGKKADLYRINRKTFRSKKCKINNSEKLSQRAMHQMVAVKGDLYLFGGLVDDDNVSDELFRIKFTQDSCYTSELITFETKPTPRLAFNFCVINMPIKIISPTPQTPPIPVLDSNTPIITPIDDWKVTIDGENVKMDNLEENPDISNLKIAEKYNPSEYNSVPLLFIHGGCDTQGEFFNDIYVAKIPI